NPLLFVILRLRHLQFAAGLSSGIIPDTAGHTHWPTWARASAHRPIAASSISACAKSRLRNDPFRLATTPYLGVRQTGSGPNRPQRYPLPSTPGSGSLLGAEGK